MLNILQYDLHTYIYKSLWFQNEMYMEIILYNSLSYFAVHYHLIFSLIFSLSRFLSFSYILILFI